MTTQTQTQTTPTSSFTTTNNITIPRGTVRSSLTFYAPPKDNSAPFNYVEQPPPGLPQRNYLESPHEVTLHDIRGQESSYNLNTHGFAVAQNIPSRVTDFSPETQIRQIYYPEIENLLLKSIPGSPSRVFIFDHTIRRSDPDARRAPVNRAHIDQTTKSALERVHLHMGPEAEKLLQTRVRLINVWRPLNGPVVASPLAFADSTTVPDEDVVAVEHRYPDRTGETAGVKYTEGGKWHYWSGMTNTERIFLQCFDSELGARTPHSAFVDPRTREGWPGRESIEVRALVFG